MESLRKEDLETGISELMQFKRGKTQFERMKKVKVFLSWQFALLERYSRNIFFSNIEKISSKKSEEIKRVFPAVTEVFKDSETINNTFKQLSRIRNICAHVQHKITGLKFNREMIDSLDRAFGTNGKVAENGDITLYGVSMILGVLLPKEDRKLLYGKISKAYCDEVPEDEKQKLSAQFDKYVVAYEDVDKRNQINLIKDLLTNDSAYNGFKLINKQADKDVRTRLGNTVLNIAKESVLLNGKFEQVVDGAEFIETIAGIYRKSTDKHNIIKKIEKVFSVNQTKAIALIGSIFGIDYEEELANIEINDEEILYELTDKVNAMLSMSAKLKFSDNCVILQIIEKGKAMRDVRIEDSALSAFVLACEYTEGMSFVRWLIAEKIKKFTFENLKPIFNSKLDKMGRVSLYLRPKNFFIGQEEYWVGKDNNFQNELKEFLVSKIYPQLAELCIESEGMLASRKNLRYEKGCLFVPLKKFSNSKALRHLRIIAFHSVVPKDVFFDGKRKVRLTTSRLKQYVNGVKSSLNDKVVSNIADKILSDIENKCSEIINDKPNVKYRMYRDYFDSQSE